MKRLFLAFLIPSLLTACAGMKSASSHDAGVSIADADLPRITDRLSKRMSAKEYQLRSGTAEKLVFVKPSGSFTTGSLYSSGPYRETESLLEVTCAFSRYPQGYRIAATSRRIENPGSVNERSTAVNEWDALQQVRGILEEVKRNLEGER
ncbi:MAG: hypothetical protein A3A86_05465 [Elusimicrobia bacterium RIFCSPLOWO2_01_FULL_60_11]|nr:MAG: hypothetical protein A3A86_05465 [Elusimicrobia bacterium RIFCSPLOWO2_01_FULL_60_11]